MIEKQEMYDLLMGRMNELYGENVPEPVLKRYQKEIDYLELSEYQNEFRLFCELLMELQSKQIVYSLIGTAAHSFLLFLLLESEMNPLPIHYYCPRCKDILFVDDDAVIGIDLPRIRCNCGRELIGNGFNLAETYFWEKEELDLKISVSEEDFEFVKRWLCENEYLQSKEVREEDYDDEHIVKRYGVGIMVVLVEKNGYLMKNKVTWEDVGKKKEKVIENYELILPCQKKIKNNIWSIYEVIRTAAFFNTMYTKSTEACVSEDDILGPEEMYSLLEQFYDNDINKAPVFQEDGLMMGEWNVGEYNFLVMFTRAFAEYVLDEINDKMQELFMEED